jgi:hypothetical protein
MEKNRRITKDILLITALGLAPWICCGLLALVPADNGIFEVDLNHPGEGYTITDSATFDLGIANYENPAVDLAIPAEASGYQAYIQVTAGLFHERTQRGNHFGIGIVTGLAEPNSPGWRRLALTMSFDNGHLSTFSDLDLSD